MIDGWLLDVHENAHNTGMMVWIIDETGTTHACEIPWTAALHVHAPSIELQQLEHWLMLPEISARFGVLGVERRAMHLDLEGEGRTSVLEVRIGPFHHLKALAEHIEARGDFHRYTLYSVDAHLVQRFLNEHGCEPFTKVRWDPSAPIILQPAPKDGSDDSPPFCVLQVGLTFDSGPFPSVHDAVRSIQLRITNEPGLRSAPRPVTEVILERTRFSSLEDFLKAFEEAFQAIDPDVVLTYGGDQRLFPWLTHQGEAAGRPLRLGRSTALLRQSTKARTVRSYGHTRHRHGAFFLEGRLHLDLRNSFIVKEGGVAGLFELAQHSCQSAQVISRLSPGSVISAIQMRVAMDDGVLVPWKKNRPEDTKSALELLHADRGGLYLDSRPGVYSSVIELDFASLFPSIIATRNISPETLNCTCCQPPEHPSRNALVPLDPDAATSEFQRRRRRSAFGHGLFPLAHEHAMRVPGLSSHTCGRRHGFLGRVVAPIIERRRQLKRQRKAKGDAFDLRQNALKWLLVTCFGYTGYRNARFGRIEAHEAICAWSREILLTTIEEAQRDGWEVLHAIVDCVWLADRRQRSHQEQRLDAEAFAARVTEQVGIPLEFEQHYDFIAFLPSRVHGSGSLTKYWAYGGGEYKIRGIELRQHSTPLWVQELQENGLALLASGPMEAGIPGPESQKRVFQLYRAELQRLRTGQVPLQSLVIARRVTTTLDDYRVKNLTYAALVRAHQQGLQVPPGGKIRYTVVNSGARDPLDRVLLAEELHSTTDALGCYQHYQQLAERAIWALLAPFGWTDERLTMEEQQATLFDFNVRRDEATTHPQRKEPFDEQIRGAGV